MDAAGSVHHTIVADMACVASNERFIEAIQVLDRL